MIKSKIKKQRGNVLPVLNHNLNRNLRVVHFGLQQIQNREQEYPDQINEVPE